MKATCGRPREKQMGKWYTKSHRPWEEGKEEKQRFKIIYSHTSDEEHTVIILTT